MTAEMRGLSLWQPWATLVAIGAKKIETRSWSTPYRGLVVIHAAKSLPTDARNFMLDSPATSALIAGLTHLHLPYRHDFFENPTRGAIVAVASLVRILATGGTNPRMIGPWPHRWVRELSEQEQAFGNFEPERYGWFLEDVRALPEPVPCRGALGLWPVPADVLAQIDAQIGVSR